MSLWQPEPELLDRALPETLTTDQRYTEIRRQARILLANVDDNFLWDTVHGWGIRDGKLIRRLNTDQEPPTCSCPDYHYAPWTVPTSLTDPRRVITHCQHTLAMNTYRRLIAELLSGSIGPKKAGLRIWAPQYIALQFSQGLYWPRAGQATWEAACWIRQHQLNHPHS